MTCDMASTGEFVLAASMNLGELSKSFASFLMLVEKVAEKSSFNVFLETP